MRYQLIVLRRRSDDRGLHELLRRFGLLDVVDVSECPPPAGLGLAAGRPTLWASAPEKLFDWVEARESVAALSLAPAEALAVLHGAVFHWDNRQVRVVRTADTAAFGPYAARVVRLEYLGVAPAGNLDPMTPMVCAAAAESGPALYVDPILLPLTHQQAAAWFARADRELAAAQAVCLPPWRLDAPADGYFAEDRLRLREQLRADCGVSEPDVNEPAAVAACRLRDRPELRDVLLDGGSLELIGQDGEPTRLRLRIWGPGGAVAAYRARFLLEPEQLPQAARAVAEILAGDLRALAPGGLELAAASAPAVWSASAGSYAGGPDGPTFGAWQVLERLAGRISDDDARAAFERIVLRPARPRGEGNADHALAERRFIENFAAGFSAAPGEDAVWRRAVCTHVLPYLEGDGRDVARRLATESATGRVRLEAVGGRWRCVHAPSCTAEEVRRWRIALPPGAVVAADAAPRLDERSALLDGRALLAEAPAPTSGPHRAPAWSVGHPLSAVDLALLEQEIADRILLADPAPGIHALEIGRSLRAAIDGDAIAVTARNLIGVTSGGRIACLNDGESLTARMPAPASAVVVFDAAIRVAVQTDEDDEDRTRLRLQIAWVADKDAGRELPDAFTLDLGRYGWRPGVAPWLLARPWVRTLPCAIRPHDDAWREFVRPLTAALEGLRRRPASNELAPLAAALDAERLAVDWMTLPIPELARRLQRLAQLAGRRARDAVNHSVVEAPRLDQLAGDLWPAALARLGEPAPEPPVRRERRLTPGQDEDYVPRPTGLALGLRFRRDLGDGRLFVHARQALPETTPLMLTGCGVAQPLRQTEAGQPIYASSRITVRAEDELLVSPLSHVWQNETPAELWFVEE